MKKILHILSAAVFLIPSISLSQITVSVGNRYSIQSTAFNTERELKIYVPDGYETSDKSYPVLYLLDGQRWYFQAVSYQRLFHEYGYTPDFIIVGIDTNDSGRYGFFQNSEKLTEFLSKDLITFDPTTKTEQINTVYFKRFMTEFIKNGVVDGVNMGWGMRYAEFSLLNHDYELAESILGILISRFPDNARPVNGLGKVQLAQGNKREAQKLFQSAVDLAEKVMIEDWSNIMLI